MTNSRARLALAAVITVAVVLGAGVLWFLFGGGPLTGPALVVQKALELRRDRSTDASAYADLFVAPDVATALASDAASSTGSPIPDWKRPYVSSETSASAEVVVRWRPSARHKGWPKATVFRLERAEERWRIGDASALASGAPVPPPAKP